MRADVIRAVEAHLNGLGNRDLSASPFHENIVFEGPIGPQLKEHPQCGRFLRDFSPPLRASKSSATL